MSDERVANKRAAGGSTPSGPHQKGFKTMNILASTEGNVNSQPHMSYYRSRAQATKARRQAKGMYKRPSKAQQEALAKSMQRDGRKLLTAEEMRLLAQHPHLHASQRAEFAALADAAEVK